jgi:REP element-mobilizing transposase RayT
MARQLSTKNPKVFGGSRLKSNPKTERPLCSNRAIHLVLKSSWATGSFSMLQKYNSRKIDAIIRITAENCAIKIYHLVNVGNHLHLVIKLKDVKAYPKFIRIITGLIARHVLKRERGPVLEQKKKLKKVKFWIARPFTRIITWGRDYNYLHNYMEKNINQAKVAFAAWGFDVIDIKMIQLLSTG